MSRKSTKKQARIYQYSLIIGAFLFLSLLAWQQIHIFWQGWFGPEGEIYSENIQAPKREFRPFKDESNHPVLIMIDNSPESRPYQEGITDALVVYETLAEGGATRLALLFAGAPLAERIGPVRSARPYFAGIAAGWGAFFWHAGGSPEARALLNKNELNSLNEISGLGPIYFWRDRAVARPHNLFTSGELVRKALQDFTLDSLPRDKLTWRWDENFNYPDEPSAAEINIDYSPGALYDAAFFYDEQSGLYRRQRDGGTVGAANVIIQKIPAEKYYPSGEGRLNLDLIGEGEMLLFRDGKVISGRWRKTDFDSQTEWLDLAGNPLPLKPGQTWVEIVPGERAVNYQ